MTTDLGSQTAFPSVQTQFNQHANGLTKRELFAAMAMQGMCANAKAVDTTPTVVAGAAIEAADALLAALESAT